MIDDEDDYPELKPKKMWGLVFGLLSVAGVALVAILVLLGYFK